MLQVLRSNVMAANTEVVAQFQQEIEFMQRTRHANIVRFFGAGTLPNGSPFLVEELMARSLQAYIQTTPDIPWDTKFSVLRDVAVGMQHIHSLGHMHRDLKTANVLINARLQAKVADFGSMRQLLLGRGSGTFRGGNGGGRGDVLVPEGQVGMSGLVGTPLCVRA